MLCSPINGHLHNLPNTCIVYGGRELFDNMIIKLINKLQQNNVNVDVITDQRLYHIYILFAHITRGNAQLHAKQAGIWCAKQLINK